MNGLLFVHLCSWAVTPGGQGLGIISVRGDSIHFMLLISQLRPGILFLAPEPFFNYTDLINSNKKQYTPEFLDSGKLAWEKIRELFCWSLGHIWQT